MYKVIFLTPEGNHVTKCFNEYPAARKFYYRCTHSKRVRLVSINFNPFR